jgi:signal transduction histidine kinase
MLGTLQTFAFSVQPCYTDQQMTLPRREGGPVPARSRSAELAALTSIAAQVNCTQDLDEILTGALETTLNVVGVDAGEVFLIDQDSGELTLHAQQGLSETFLAEETSFGAGECLCGLSVRSREPVVAEDIAAHPARSRPACLREGFRSLLCLPLRARDEVLGVLNVQSRSTRQFNAEDEELLSAIGNQIGVAIANAQLIDDAEQRRATLDSVMNSLVDGLVLLDNRGRIAYCNPRAGKMLDLSRRALAGRPIQDLDASIAKRLSDASASTTPLQAALADPDNLPVVELALSLPAPRTLQGRFFLIQDGGGHNLGMGLLLRDITREREVDAMKSQLLSTVSHELRTPLASIKGFATTLLRQDVEWDETNRREFLSIIDEESDRLSELISNLLDMSRIEAGTLRIELEPTDLAPIIHETAEAFRVQTHRHTFQVDLPGVLPPVLADPRRTRQVLRNLVDNAVKYSPDGGDIGISASAGPEAVQVVVSDQGLGIEAQYLEHIFDRFYQVDSASTRAVGGSGLGLSICKAILDAHGGRIWVESEVGLGTSFYFTLPIAGPEHGL